MSERSVSFRRSLTVLLRARVPLLYVESFEEPRVLCEVRAVAADPARVRTVRPVLVWSVTRGFVAPDGSVVAGTEDPVKAVAWMARREGPGVFVMLDLHAHLGDDRRTADPDLVRGLRELAAVFQDGLDARALVVVAPVVRIPVELEREMTLVDFPLPGAAEIGRVLDAIVAANASGRITVDLDDAGREGLVSAALGLTVGEASNAFAKAMVDDGRLTADDAAVVLAEKRAVVRKAGLLEFVDAHTGLSDVGGLTDLKRWFHKRTGLWRAEARDYGLSAPKGVLITGVPGCGKSLTAKAAARVWGLPLLRLDVGRVFGGLLGSSEANMRSVLRTAEAVAPCIVWIDEIEKGFAGVAGDGDSGTAGRVFGSFLTWMGDTSAPVFVIATANRVDRLPPELVRKGRFDEVFFVDLPTAVERAEIWAVQLRRVEGSRAGGDVHVDQGLCARLAAASDGFSGAEIEQAVRSGLVDAFADRRKLSEWDLFRVLKGMTAMSVTQAVEVAQVRRWALTHAVPATALQDQVTHADTVGSPGGGMDGVTRLGSRKGDLS